MKADWLIKKIADDLGVRKLYLVDEEYLTTHDIPKNICKSVLTNRSYIVGNEIVIGIYDNESLRLISFFHELGHYINEPDDYCYNVNYSTYWLDDDSAWLESDLLIHEKYETRYQQELMAWITGLNKATEYGIIFDLDTYKIGCKYLESYAELED